MHFDGCSRGVFLAGDAQVSLVSLEEFSGGSRIFLQLHKSPLPPIEVVKRAFWSLGKRGYHCQAFNCEHFAAWCTTGEAGSSQAWFSCIYVDPVFPFGWAAAAAKDASHLASDLLADNARACPCGRENDRTPLAHDDAQSGSSGALCSAGHLTCHLCLSARRLAASSAAVRRCGSTDGESDPSGKRPLCCMRPACWADLQSREAQRHWQREARPSRATTTAALGRRRSSASGASEVHATKAALSSADDSTHWRRRVLRTTRCTRRSFLALPTGTASPLGRQSQASVPAPPAGALRRLEEPPG